MGADPDLTRLVVGMADDARLTGVSRRRFLKAALALSGTALSGGALLTLLEACASGSNNPSANTNATVTMAVFQEPDTLDPSASGLITVGAISHCIFDTLIWDLPGHGSTPFYAGLATSWEASSDATAYTFKLRKDVKFHDGTPFNAQAVKFTFDHIVDPNTKSKSSAGSLGPYQGRARAALGYSPWSASASARYSDRCSAVSALITLRWLSCRRAHHTGPP